MQINTLTAKPSSCRVRLGLPAYTSNAGFVKLCDISTMSQMPTRRRQGRRAQGDRGCQWAFGRRRWCRSRDGRDHHGRVHP